MCVVPARRTAPLLNILVKFAYMISKWCGAVDFQCTIFKKLHQSFIRYVFWMCMRGCFKGYGSYVIPSSAIVWRPTWLQLIPTARSTITMIVDITTYLVWIKAVKGKLATYEIDVFISIWYNHPSTMPSQYIRGQHLNRWCIKIIAL